MIEIDIAPAPSSASSSPSVPPGAADEFASALQHAGGRGQGDSATRTPDDDAPRNEVPEREVEPQTASTEDSASAPATDEVAAEDTPEADEPTTPVAGSPTAQALTALTTATTTEPKLVEATIEPELAATDGETADDPTVGVISELGVVAEPESTPPVDQPAVPVATIAPTEVEGDTPLTPDTPTPESVVAEAEVDPQVSVPQTAAVDAETAVTGAPIANTVSVDAGAESSAPVAEPSPHAVVDDAVATIDSETPVVTDADSGIDVDVAPASTPAPTPASPSTTAPRGDAAIAAMTEVASPAPVSTPPAATTVDPTAAADAAAMAELDVPTPPQQIAEALRDVRRMADGSHRLSLQLYPEELGVVQLEVAVREGQLHLRAATELDATRRLLNASLPELREQLADAGVSAGSLEVGAETAGGDRSASDDGPAAVRSGFDEPGAGDRPTVSDATTLTAPGRLDVRL